MKNKIKYIFSKIDLISGTLVITIKELDNTRSLYQIENWTEYDLFYGQLLVRTFSPNFCLFTYKQKDKLTQ